MAEQTHLDVRALKTPSAARYLGVSPRTLQDWRARAPDDPGEHGPRFITVTPRLVVYEVVELNRWLDEKRRLEAIAA